jgi:hypothetical protein
MERSILLYASAETGPESEVYKEIVFHPIKFLSINIYVLSKKYQLLFNLFSLLSLILFPTVWWKWSCKVHLVVCMRKKEKVNNHLPVKAIQTSLTWVPVRTQNDHHILAMF